jgi:hypothetical protein
VVAVVNSSGTESWSNPVELTRQVREQISEQLLSRATLERLVGAKGVASLRRYYFPRWRAYPVHEANRELWPYRRLVVKDQFEKKLVEAVKPTSGLEVQVLIEDQ